MDKTIADTIMMYQKLVLENPRLTVGEYKRIGRELRDKYNLTDMEAINLLKGNNVLEIIVKIERQQNQED